MKQVAKILCVCLTFGFSLISVAIVPPLERTLTIQFKQEKMADVLRKIGQQVGVSFSYGATAFDANRQVTQVFERKSVREIIDALFEGTVKAKQKGAYIILTKSEKNVVAGYIRESGSGENLKDVTVYDPVSLRSAVTDSFGYFEIDLKKLSTPDVQLLVKKVNYIDTLMVVPNKTRELQQVKLTREEKRWENFKTRLETKMDGIWRWTKNQAVRINQKNMNDTLYRVGQVSFVPFLGTNHKMSGHVVNGYSLNVLGGYSAGTKALEVGGLFNMNRGNVTGAQVAGLFAINGGTTTGAQVSGIFNVSEGDVVGMQVGGIFNRNEGKTHGFQMGGILNSAQDTLIGMQTAGILNVADANVLGIQLAGITNLSTEVTGMQVAGIINKAKKVKGVQVGLINVADSLQGAQLGLINWVKRGYHRVEVSTDEVMPISVAFRSGTTKLHSLLAIGHQPKGDTATWSFGLGLGSLWNLSRRLSFNADVSSHQLVRNRFEEENQLHKLFLGFDCRVAKNLSVAGGVTLNFNVFAKEGVDPTALFQNYQPSVRVGSLTERHGYQWWWGAKVGVRFW